MPDIDIEKLKKQSAQAAKSIEDLKKRESEYLAWDKTINGLLDSTRSAAQNISTTDKDKGLDRQQVINLFDAMHDAKDILIERRAALQDKTPAKGGGKPTGFGVSRNAEKDEKALRDIQGVVNDTLGSMAMAHDPLSNPKTPSEAKEYAVVALKYETRKYTRKVGGDISIGAAISAASDLADSNGVANPGASDKFMGAVDASIKIASDKKNDLSRSKDKLRDDLAKARKDPKYRGIERLENSIAELEKDIKNTGEFSTSLQAIKSNVRAVIGSPKKEAPKKDTPEAKEEIPLTFKDSKQAMEYVSTLTTTNNITQIEINGKKRDNLKLMGSIAQIESQFLKEDVTKEFASISGQAFALSRGLKEINDENLKPIDDSINKIKVKLNAVGSDTQKVYTEKDHKSAVELLEYTQKIEEAVKQAAARKQGMAVPGADLFDGLVPAELKATKLAVADKPFSFDGLTRVPGSAKGNQIS